MITKKRVVLVTTSKNPFYERFEALVCIDDIEEIEFVWRRNKTPIIVSNHFTHQDLKKYEVVEIPESLIGKIEEFTDFCHANEFECGEYRTGKVFDTSLERCVLCEIARHKGMENLERYNQFVDKPVDCIIYESPNFYVVPELGALKQGFLMIVPKKHILSVAQFPEELMSEYYEVCKDVEKMLRKAFNGKVVSFFEHGSGPSGMTSHKKSIVHAHTHVVVDFILKKKYQDMVQMKVCNNISVAKNVHYFSYQEGTDGKLLIAMDPEVYVQRQFPRQVMADELGLAPGQYNWRGHEFNEVTDATLFYLHRMLKKEKAGRVYERTRAFVKGFSMRTKNS